MMRGALLLLLLAMVAVIGSTRPSDAEAVFPGTNGRIAFERDRDHGPDEIFTMNPDGSDVRQLTFTASENSGPSWSPDGTKIAFTSFRDGNAEVYVMNADGTGQTNLSNHEGDDAGPSWSPDGSQIVFQSKRTGSWEIYVMRADGSDQRQLTFDDETARQPTWSPDGSQIAYGQYYEGWLNIFVMNADGSDQHPVTKETSSNYSVSWSPLGDRLAFYSSRNGDPAIYTMKLDGSDLVRVTQPGPPYPLSPAWSPDGTKIVFMLAFDIFVIDADGENEVQLTDNYRDFRPDTDWYPDWQPIPRPGNADCQGEVDAVDAAVVLQYTAGLLTSLPCANAADLNADATVNAIDAALILQYTAGLLGSLPP